MIGSAFVALALIGQPAIASETSVNDVARKYWLVRYDLRIANWYHCSLPEASEYKAPTSPLLGATKRMGQLARRLEAIDKQTFYNARAGMILPPPNHICDQPDDAQRAHLRAEKQLSELETLADLLPNGDQ